MAAIRNEPRLEELPTEGRDPAGADLDLRSTEELVRLIGAADATVPAAVAAAHAPLVTAIDEIVERLGGGGRLVYAGAGTSGRLALVDAVECQSTFGLDPGRVVALVAGGAASTASAQEHAEDNGDAGAAELRALTVNAQDAVVGVSASGRTPYVLGALAQHEVAVVVGAEVLAGSTRLKAGTAQKLVLNTISTVTMVRLGKTYGNLMVDVVATNHKLRARARRIVEQATESPPDEVDAAISASGGDAKLAIVMLLAGVDAGEAQQRLASAGGVVRKALAS